MAAPDAKEVSEGTQLKPEHKTTLKETIIYRKDSFPTEK